MLKSILGATLAVGLAAGPAGDHFVGKVMVEWLDNPAGPDRTMKLLAPFAYVDPNGTAWEVPASTVIDGASIPRFFWTTIGSPFTGDYRKASVVHDYYCDVKTRKWQDVHRMFLDACITGGVKPVKAKIMYKAVYAKGPRWEKVIAKGAHKSTTYTIIKKADVDSARLARIDSWIERTNPTVERINDTLDKLVKVRIVN